MDGISGALITSAQTALDQRGVSKTGGGVTPPGDAHPGRTLGDDRRRVATGDRVSPIGAEFVPERAGDPSRGDVVHLSRSGRAAARGGAVSSLYPVGRGGHLAGAGADEVAPHGPSAHDEAPLGNRPEETRPAPSRHDHGTDKTSEPKDARASTEAGHEGRKASSGPAPTLTPDEERQVELLAARDREVRAHEQAHKSAGGQHAGAISLSYTTGPDGKRYASSGEVPVDLSPVSGDPEATIQKLNQIARAALAPADPSSADRRVAARAARLVRKAQRDVLEDAMRQENTETRPSAPSSAKASVDSAAEEAAAADAEEAETRAAGDASETAESMAPIEPAKKIAGNPHHRPPSVAPNAQVPVRLNLSVYA